MSVAGQRTPQRGRGGYSRRGGPALDTAWRTVTPAPAVMLYGPEEYFASRAAARLRELFREAHPEVDRVQMNAATYTAGELTLQASPSLFGSAKIIEVENVASMSEDFLTDTLAYLKAPEPDIMLILNHSGGNRGKKLIDLVRSQFVLVNCKALKTEGRVPGQRVLGRTPTHHRGSAGPADRCRIGHRRAGRRLPAAARRYPWRNHRGIREPLLRRPYRGHRLPSK